jgi:hypothetical protein
VISPDPGERGQHQVLHGVDLAQGELGQHAVMDGVGHALEEVVGVDARVVQHLHEAGIGAAGQRTRAAGLRALGHQADRVEGELGEIFHLRPRRSFAITGPR